MSLRECTIVIDALESARSFCISASKDRVRIKGFDHSKNSTVVEIDLALQVMRMVRSAAIK